MRHEHAGRSAAAALRRSFVPFSSLPIPRANSRRLPELEEGYPYFLQEYGSIVWDLGNNAMITVSDVDEAQELVEVKLDGSFFKVRAERTTDLELQFLRAMAELGPEPQQARDVAGLLERTSGQLGPIRARLIDKGLLYTPGFGLAASTVPQFDRYMRRAHKPVVPPVQRRGKP
ncbi:MAG TPA: hypothetical protein VHU14_04760 [Solirubrobacterales bacterium]|nr:hypothetical protein [Solirubrobacterales bacterium]